MSYGGSLSNVELEEEAQSLDGKPQKNILFEMAPPNDQNSYLLTNDESGDDILLVEVGRGSKEALALLFRRHRRTVVNVAQRILRDPEEAEDLCQEVFVRLFQKASLFDPGRGSALSWIIQIAYHRAFNRRKYLALRMCSDSDESANQLIGPKQESLFVNGLIAKEITHRLRGSLTKEQFRTLELFFFEGYTLREIAEKTGETLGCIRNRYYRSLERLRSLIFDQQKT